MKSDIDTSMFEPLTIKNVELILGVVDTTIAVRDNSI